MEYAELSIAGEKIQLPVITGTMKEKAIDISELRKKTGYITLDPGYQNTGSCLSNITFIDGEKGVLKYRGIDIETLAEKSSFIETAYLLVYGKLPTRDQRTRFSNLLTENSLLHEDMITYFDGMPTAAHPMAILSSMVNSLSIYYPHYFVDDDDDDSIFQVMAARLISKIRTIAAFSYKKSVGEPFVYPRHDLKYCANFLHMMFNSPVKPYEPNDDEEKILNMLLVLHADHEQNCSTSTVRLVGRLVYNSFCKLG